jgi:pilus assembly protein CpaF
MTLLDRVRTRLIAEQQQAGVVEVAAALRAEGVVLADHALGVLVEDVRRELAGAGPLEDLLADPRVTDVLVNSPDEVYVDRGAGLERVHVDFGSEERVRALAQRLASRAGRRLDDASPHVDARLPEGGRLHCVLSPIATDGTCISIRLPRAHAITVDLLVSHGSIDAAGADLLRALVHNRRACVVTGGTGSGKTTVLNSLLGEVAPEERIVIAEDSVELAPRHPHVVRLQSRMPNIEGAGAITLRDLVRQTLRMRPDRIVLGEVRGNEIIDLLTAMNTGHEGSWATIHANAAVDLPARVEALGLLAGVPRQAMHALLASAVDAVVHVQRLRDGRRIVSGIHVLDLEADGLVRALPAFTYDGRESARAEAWDMLCA